MGAKTKIQWCHHSVNFWWGCTKVSLGCKNCYAELLAKLFSRGRATWGPTGKRDLRPEAATKELLKLDAAARKARVRRRVFINSMSDTFEERADLDAVRLALWEVAARLTNLDLMLLTKRPEAVWLHVPMMWLCGEWPAHVWIGTTADTQAMADERIAHLRTIPAAVRFLSVEPMLEAITLPTTQLAPSHEGHESFGINWVIVGGESGAGARPFDLDGARAIVAQCQANAVPVFVKQLGSVWARGMNATRSKRRKNKFDGHGGLAREWPRDLRVREMPRS